MDKNFYQVELTLRLVMSEEDDKSVLAKSEELLFAIKKLVEERKNTSSVDASIIVNSGFELPTKKYSQVLLSLVDARGKDKAEVLLTLDGFGRWVDFAGEEWGLGSIMSANPIVIHVGN